MKRLLFLFAFSTLLLVSCNDDDENENPPGGGDPGQPTSGSITATINGESFSSANNVARELSYGDFMIRSEADGKSLKFILDEFIGNATYTFSNLTTGSNRVEYYTEVNGELIGFESLSGELTISDYDQSAQSFNTDFDIIFGRIGNGSITMTGKGNYTALDIIEILEPSSGETTVFYNEKEYFQFEDSVSVYDNDFVSLNFNSDNESITFEMTSTDSNDPTKFNLFIHGNDISLSGGEILQYNYDHANDLVSGRIKNSSPDIDFEVWFEDIAVEMSSEPFFKVPTFNYNGEIIEFDIAFLTLQELDDNEVRFSFEANQFSQTLKTIVFVFYSLEATQFGFDQTVNGFVNYQNPFNPDTNILQPVKASMTLEPGSIEGAANVEIIIPEVGVLNALDVPVL